MIYLSFFFLESLFNLYLTKQKKVTAECNKKLANAEANLVNVEKNAKAKIASASAKVFSLLFLF